MKKGRDISHISIKFLFNLASWVLMISSAGIVFLGIFVLTRAWLSAFHIVEIENEHYSERPGLLIIEAIDIVLIGVVLFIFSYSLNTVVSRNGNDDGSPTIFNLTEFSKNKLFLWQAFLTTLLFVFMASILRADDYSYDLLYVPIAMLIISGALKLISSIKH